MSLFVYNRITEESSEADRVADNALNRLPWDAITRGYSKARLSGLESPLERALQELISARTKLPFAHRAWARAAKAFWDCHNDCEQLYVNRHVAVVDSAYWRANQESIGRLLMSAETLVKSWRELKLFTRKQAMHVEATATAAKKLEATLLSWRPDEFEVTFRCALAAFSHAAEANPWVGTAHITALYEDLAQRCRSYSLTHAPTDGLAFIDGHKQFTHALLSRAEETGGMSAGLMFLPLPENFESELMLRDARLLGDV